MSRDEQDNSGPPTIKMDVVRSKSEKLRKVASSIAEAVIADTYQRKPGTRIQHKLHEAARHLLARFYRASCVSDTCCVGIPRDNNAYGTASRLGRLFFTSDITLPVVDWMTQDGYIVLVKPGVKFAVPRDHYNDKELTGYVTAYQATDKLCSLFRAENIELAEIQDDIDPSTLVELRDREGEIIDLPDAEIVRRSQALLGYYNQLLSRTYIDFDEVVGSPMLKHAPDKCDKTVRRIFTGSLEQGGRFYGGFWQSLPERDKYWDAEAKKTEVKKAPRRLFLYINGEMTAEIDFRAIHPTLLYVKEGLDLRKHADLSQGYPDLYATCRFSNNPSKDRRLAKKAFLIGLNAELPEKQYEALRAEIIKDRDGYPELPNLKNETMAQVFDKVYKAHPALKDYFGSGTGLGLQYWDSLIAERVIEIFTYQYGIPVLPVHDSFIVPATEYQKLAKTMFECFKQLAKQINPDIQHDYTFGDILDLDNTDLTAPHELAKKLGDTKFMEQYPEHVRNLAELSHTVQEIFSKDNPARPIQDREVIWRGSGNTVPFDSI